MKKSKDKYPALTDEEHKILELYRGLPDENKKTMIYKILLYRSKQISEEIELENKTIQKG